VDAEFSAVPPAPQALSMCVINLLMFIYQGSSDNSKGILFVPVEEAGTQTPAIIEVLSYSFSTSQEYIIIIIIIIIIIYPIYMNDICTLLG